MSNEYAPVDSQYIKGTTTTGDTIVPTPTATESATNTTSKQTSATKDFLREAIVPEDLARYGAGKPQRIILRAKLIND